MDPDTLVHHPFSGHGRGLPPFGRQRVTTWKNDLPGTDSPWLTRHGVAALLEEGVEAASAAAGSGSRGMRLRDEAVTVAQRHLTCLVREALERAALEAEIDARAQQGDSAPEAPS
eukprot:ctg_2339.g433